MSKNEKKLNFWIRTGRLLFSGGDSCGRTGKIIATIGVGTLAIGYVLILGADFANSKVRKYKKLLQVETTKKK